MLSFRAISRSVPRTFSRSIAISSRSALRPGATLPKPAFLQPWKQATKPAYAAFSTSSIFRQDTVDELLLAKLEDEFKHEVETGVQQSGKEEQNVKDVMKSGGWDVKDVPGDQEVVLSKAFGNEKIRVTFTVADIQNLGDQSAFEDSALGDEMDFEQHQAVNQRNASGAVAQHPEDSVAPADREVDEMMNQAAFPARVNVTIEKANVGALLVQTIAQEGYFQIEEVSYFNKPELAIAQTAESDWARQSLYGGPPFENLDEDLQAYFERYLDERGINAELANMVPDYISLKEQREYIRWLEGVKNFVAA